MARFCFASMLKGVALEIPGTRRWMMRKLRWNLSLGNLFAIGWQFRVQFRMRLRLEWNLSAKAELTEAFSGWNETCGGAQSGLTRETLAFHTAAAVLASG